MASSLWLLVHCRTAHPYGILASSFDIEHRLVGQGEQARAIGGVFWIGGDTEAGLNMHLQPAACQKLCLAQRPPHLLGFVQGLPLAQAREDNHELIASVTHAKGGALAHCRIVVATSCRTRVPLRCPCVSTTRLKLSISRKSRENGTAAAALSATSVSRA